MTCCSRRGRLPSWPSTGRSRWPWPRGRKPGWRRSRSWRPDGRLAGYRYLPAAKADLLRRLGRRDEAARAYRAALALTENSAERAFLGRRIAEAGGQPGPGSASG